MLRWNKRNLNRKRKETKRQSGMSLVCTSVCSSICLHQIQAAVCPHKWFLINPRLDVQSLPWVLKKQLKKQVLAIFTTCFEVLYICVCECVPVCVCVCMEQEVHAATPPLRTKGVSKASDCSSGNGPVVES